jgi:aldose 1-epimerase
VAVPIVPPTGTQYEIRAGEISAVVTQVGGGLRALRAADRDLVAGFPADRERPLYRGSVLAPWPNRVGDGRYRWNGRDQQLSLTEPDRRSALHGLVCWSSWEPVDVTGTSAELATRIWPQPGYPHLLDLRVRYWVDERGLHWQLDALNVGEAVAPYGCSVHPYLVPGAGRVDDWTLTLPAARYLEVDPDRLLPRDLRDVTGTSFDLRRGGGLRGLSIDHAFTDVAAEPDGLARVVARSEDGTGVVLEWDPATLPWVQLHTADRPEPDLDRSGLAVEPMTCPPNALQTGAGLIALAPGQRHSARWRIGPV